MKYKIFCVFIILLFATVLGAEVQKVGSGINSISAQASNANETIIQYQIGQYEIKTVHIDGRDYHTINLPKEGFLQERGNPALPVVNRSIIIPRDAHMHLEVTDVEYVDIAMPIAPSKGIITRDIDPDTIPYEFGSVYHEDAFYPGEMAALSKPYILRDYRGITVQCSPMAYNPRTETLRIYTAFKIRVYALGTDTENTLATAASSISREFMPIYENHFINWQSQRYTPVSDTFGKLLVICHSSFLSQIEPYLNWKRQKGIQTELVSFSTVGTTASQLQSYIQNRYNADNSIAYVQLVGDAPQIPTLKVSGGGSDPSFSLVAGSDSYPDIFIGRFSATNVTELNAQINKAIAYERDANTSDTWLQRAMGIASAEGGGGLGDMGESDIAHMNLIRTDLLNDGYTSVDQIYDPGALASTVTTNVNTGRGFINYVGHGSTTSWGTTGFNNTNATNLTNGNKTPFIMDVACVNGNFVSTTCFAEAWLRNSAGGTVAMYASSINQSWNSPMRAQDECTDLLIAESKTTIGGLFFNASCKMIDVYGTDGMNMFKTWHIFGDASLQVRSKTPQVMTVTHPARIDINTGSVTVNTGVANALAAISSSNVLYGSAFADASGQATISLSALPQAPTSLSLTVTAFNKVTYLGQIQLMESLMPDEPRFVAEWEPALGAIVRYPLGLPYSMITDLSNDALLYVVASSANQPSARSALTANGVNMANVHFITAATDSYWIRDYGPWTIFDADNQMHIVDFTYNRPRPNDDLIPEAVASYLGVDTYDLDIVHTGGNIMTDGQGKAMSTELVMEENPSLTQSQIEEAFSDMLGINEYQLYPDPNNTYIDHIDCWAKLLDVDKVLIRQVPQSHPQYTAIEQVVSEWQSKTSSLGTPYRIYRIYTPNNEPYTNSFILNNKIYVPQMGTANDASALLTYSQAMPGYTIEGYSHATFESTDAIHCRVNTIFDPQMVAMQHIQPSDITSHQVLTLSVDIDHSNALDLANCYLSWKAGSNGTWQQAMLTPNREIYTASFTAPAAGDTIFYWITAADTAGKTCRLPLCGNNDPYQMIVNIPSQLPAPEVSIAPQPTGYSLSWDQVPFAQSYRIYYSPTPNGDFILTGTTSNIYWFHETNSPMMFYRIVAVWLP